MRGLYGATATLISDDSISPAFATPITSPDLSKCTKGTNLNTQSPLDVNCCPPASPEIIDYKLQLVTKMRVRLTAHLAGKEYYTKYEKAIALMKALPAGDPRNFMQQANASPPPPSASDTTATAAAFGQNHSRFVRNYSDSRSVSLGSRSGP
ncbi:hypothetical protein ACS0TY_022505 [Phlomoides rotata]